MAFIKNLYQAFQNASGVTTDTRSLAPGQIFFALKGPNFNANTFAAQALEKGAVLAVVDEPAYAQQPNTLLVPNVLKALQQLATHHRQQINIPVLGITGSNGKTTTKELVYSVLAQKYKAYATHGNLNNHIGVPLTILSMPANTELAIIEMGANKVGDIAELCAIAQPTHGLITNIGKAHLEGFGGPEGVLRGKSELYDWLRKTNGTPFINTLQKPLANMAKRFAQPVLYPQQGQFYACKALPNTAFVTVETPAGRQVQTHLMEPHHFHNIATALCVGQYFEVPALEAEQAVAAYVPQNNRSQIVEKGAVKVIADAYNANPNSMLGALENLAAVEAAHKAVVLGDMLELGTYSQEEHANIGRWLANHHFDHVYLCGPEMQHAASQVPGAHWFHDTKGLTFALKEAGLAGQPITWLVKGSRGLGLEQVLPLLLG